jgi:tetratricopeptide (TPR) repeat protein
LLLRALAVAGSVRQPTDPELAGPLGNLGKTYRREHRLPEAESMERRAVSILEVALPGTMPPSPGHPRLAGPLSKLAAVLTDEARFDEAQALFERSLAISVRPDTLLSYAAVEWRALAFRSAKN